MSRALEIVRLSGLGSGSTSQYRVPCAAHEPVGVTIGNFDGLHLGHQEVISKLVSMVRQAAAGSGGQGTAVVLSFYPHPSVVLGKAPRIPQITPLHQKASILEASGVTRFVLVHFTPTLARLSAGEFLDRYILGALGATHAVLGPDTALGKNREGGKEFIAEHLSRAGVVIDTVEFKAELGERVSSRRIRALIDAGDVGAAGMLLGRPYALEGRVQKGQALGRSIGIPTANLCASDQVMPRNGVYASLVRLPNGVQCPAVTNIGVRPTVSKEDRVGIESHLLGYSGDLYGQRIEVALVERIRDERKFSGVAELTTQIAADITKAKEIFSL